RLVLTADGQRLKDASEEGQQLLLRRLLIDHVPLVAQIQEAILASSRGEVEGDEVLDLLNEQFTGPEADAVFETFVSWTRSCGLFRYNREQDRFRLVAEEAAG
ncbi:MAG: ABC-type anion transport system for nitrate/sulfonate/bicarbonate, ATPase component, partial [Cyanobacteriota bacterium]